MNTQKHSGLGIASLIMSLLCGMGILLCIVLATFLESTVPGGIEASGLDVLVGLSVLLILVVQIVALTLGVVALFQKGRKKLFAVLGTVFSLLVIVLVFGIILVGMLYS